jgi:hypothetical protein
MDEIGTTDATMSGRPTAVLCEAEGGRLTDGSQGIATDHARVRVALFVLPVGALIWSRLVKGQIGVSLTLSCTKRQPFMCPASQRLGRPARRYSLADTCRTGGCYA